MATTTINNLTLRKHAAKQWVDSHISYLSAAWVLDEIPGLVIQQRRPEDDYNGAPSWAMVTDMVLSWNHCNREIPSLIDQGYSYDSSLVMMYRKQAAEIMDAIKAGLPLADQIAFHFNTQRFPTRDAALQALDMYLFSLDTSL